MFWHRLTGKWVGVVQPLNYWVYDHDIFIRCQSPWGGAKSAKKLKKVIWSVNYGFAESKNAQIARF